MLGESDSGKGNPQVSGDDRFLSEIEALSKVLSLDPKHSSRRRRSLPSSSSDADRRSQSADRSILKPSSLSSSSRKEKKPGPSRSSSSSSSHWGWNPIKKALSHISGHRRFDCWFSLRVHSIEGLPPALSGAALAVHWRRTTDPASAAAATRPVRVVNGAAQFEQTLTYRCPVSATRTGPGGTAKYEARHFLIYPALAGGAAAPGSDLGRHLVDLTRVLPASLEELGEKERAFGKWSTDFRLSGRARDAVLNVSFGFSLVGNDPMESVCSSIAEKKVTDVLKTKEEGLDFRNRQGSIAGVGSRLQQFNRSRSVVDEKVLHEVSASLKSEVFVVANNEREEELEKCNDDSSERLSTLDDDANPKIEIIHEKKQLCELMYCESSMTSEVAEVAVANNEREEELEKCNDDSSERLSTLDDDANPKIEIIHEKKQLCELMYCESSMTSEVAEVAVHSSRMMKPCTPAELVEVNKDQECEEPEFTVLEQGIEFTSMSEICEACTKNDGGEANNAELKTKLDPPVAEEAQRSSHNLQGETLLAVEPATEDLDSIFENLSILQRGVFEFPNAQGKQTEQLRHCDIKSDYKTESSLGRSRSLDDVTESIASEFLSMLGLDQRSFELSSDGDPNSPREQLWKQFEKESLASGDDLFGLDTGFEKQSSWDDFSDELDLTQIANEVDAELLNSELSMNRKSRVKMLEDAETEALMREWGLNERAFHCSPPSSRGGFGSPIDLPPEEPLELPHLGEGLGSIVQTENGGFLRSMNPLLFKNANNDGNLIMQVSNPIVVPAEMGSGIMEILQQLASVGIEKLSKQASKLMPLDDITGKTLHQIAGVATTTLDSCERHDLLYSHYPEAQLDASQNLPGRRKSFKGSTLAFASSDVAQSDYVSLEDLAPMAMDKIEALSIEGLRIQTGCSDEEAPSSISAHSIALSASERKGSNNSYYLGMEGTAGLQLLDIKDGEDEVDGLIGLSVSLDEWMRLDSGMIYEDDQVSDRTSRILAAHHANSIDLIGGGPKRGKRSGRKWGLLGNNFIVALMVQLRDPLRNYEPVGTPMLALIQVERVFVPPKPIICKTVSEKGNSEQEDEPKTDDKPLAEKKHEEEIIPQFKITEVHVAGLKAEPSKRSIWGNPKQQQSGSRWLLASGMGKGYKHPLMKSRAVAKPSPEISSTVQPGDTLWSISSRVTGNGAKRKDVTSLNPHIRNPNVILPNESIRLH